VPTSHPEDPARGKDGRQTSLPGPYGGSEGEACPEPVVSSYSDVDLVEYSCVEQRQWRLRRAFNKAKGRVPTGSTEVEWASKELPQDQQAPGNHAESVAPGTPRHALEFCIPPPEVAEDWATSLPRWLPEIPSTHAEVRAATAVTRSHHGSNNPSNASSINPNSRSNSKGTRRNTTFALTSRRHK